MSSDLGEPVGVHAGKKYDTRSRSGAFRSINNCASDKVVVQIATWSLTVIAAKIGTELRLSIVVSASIALFTKGKLYRLTVQADAKTSNGAWIAQTIHCEVWLPNVGSWEVRSHQLLT